MATLLLRNQNLDIRLPSIMTRLTSNGITKYPQENTFHKDKATIHWSIKILDNILPFIMISLPSIGVTKN